MLLKGCLTADYTGYLNFIYHRPYFYWVFITCELLRDLSPGNNSKLFINISLNASKILAAPLLAKY